MKKGLVCMILCAVAIGLLSGCGGRFAEEMTAGKDGTGAVTGSAVSGQVVQSDDYKEGIRCGVNSQSCSEHYCYEAAYYNENWVGDGIIQISLDTQEEKGFEIDGVYGVVYVEKNALYYTKEADEDEEEICYSLWRVPIECHADGTEVLKTDQAEKLKGLDDIYYVMDNIYIDDEYIVYSGNRGKSGDTDVILYDRKNAEKVSMPLPKESEEYLRGDIYEIHRYGDRLYVITACGIVSWDMGKGKVSAYAVDENEWAFVSMGTMIFYCGECLDQGEGKLDITCIDMETGKTTEFISKKEILDGLAEKVGIQEKQLNYVYAESMYYDADCFYIDLYVEYEKGDTCYYCYIMLSRGSEEGAQLKYEKSLTEYMWEKEKEVWSRGRTNAKEVKAKCGACEGINQGMAYMCLNRFDDKDEKRVIYDLKTDKVRPADWKDKLMFEVIAD